MRLVALIPSSGLLLGAASGLLLPTPSYTFSSVTLVVCLAVAAWARASRPAAFVVAVWLAFTVGGALLAADAWRDAWRPTLRTAFERLGGVAVDEAPGEEPRDVAVPVEILGVLRTDASRRAGGVSLSVDVQSIRRLGVDRSVESVDARGGVLLTVSGELAYERLGQWRAGRVIRAPAELRRPARYLNPGVPDAERVLARQGTTLVGTVKSGLLVEVVERGGRLSEAAASGRSLVRRAVALGVGPWSARSAGIVTAIVIGDRTGLDADVERRLQEAGTYHVIAISGGNIAVLTGLALILFRLAGHLGRSAALATAGALVAYCFLVGNGGGRSVERATLMAVVYLAGRALDLTGAPLNTLAVVAALIVAAEPLAATDPGFLLTCGATAGILILLPVVQEMAMPRALRPVVALLAASIASEAMLMPVGAGFFSRVTFAGLLLNLAAVPLMAVAQIAGMALVPIALVWPAAAWTVGGIAHLGAEGLVESARLVTVAPWLTWRVAPPAASVIGVYYVGLIAAWVLWRVVRPGAGERPAVRRLRTGGTLLTAAAAVWILAEPWTVAGAGGDGRLHVTFLDVGQGDATLLRFPRGGSWLVDAGGLATSSAFDIGDRVVAPVLRHLGIRRLDTAVLSHAHPDHAGGLPSIVREFRPRDVWDGVPVPRLDSRQALMREAEAVEARWTEVKRHQRLLVDGVEVIVRHPPLHDWERQDVRNDDSIVLELRWGDVSIVLPGDIGRAVEADIAAAFEPARLRVLKVPHHGSLTSSSVEFLDALRPRVAIVSAGRGNRYGHPAAGVLARYQGIGADVFRTDRNGAIALATDGHVVRVETFAGGAAEFR